MNPTIASLVRHGLTAAGGFLIAKGLASAGQVGELAGAVVTHRLASSWSVIKNKNTPPPPPAAPAA
jgi:hypothetical protein